MSYALNQIPWRNDFAHLGSDFGTPVSAEPLRNPRLVAWDAATAARLGIQDDASAAVQYFSGATPLPGSSPVAMVYSGHQFGQFAGQLGDGRGLLLGDFQQHQTFWDIHLKGAGRTPYSRFGDGRAVLRSCIREYLASIALHGLGIPTSHALCILVGDEQVEREKLEPRAALVRVAQTHVRFGSFEHFFYTRQEAQLKRLAEFVIERYLPAAAGRDDRYVTLFATAVETTATMIAHWQAMGFAHGVMNTDNMSILGETLDYGPYGFMETYDPSLICNHSDHHGRYAFELQPEIGFWNLQALAQSLSPLISTEHLTSQLRRYRHLLAERYGQLMRHKLGLVDAQPDDRQLNTRWLNLLFQGQVDYSLGFRSLSGLTGAEGEERWLNQFTNSEVRESANTWLGDYLQRRKSEATDPLQRETLLQTSNPLYILRNYLAQEAIVAAEAEDYSVLHNLAACLAAPSLAVPGRENFAEPAPAWAQSLSVSCSS